MGGLGAEEGSFINRVSSMCKGVEGSVGAPSLLAMLGA